MPKLKRIPNRARRLAPQKLKAQALAVPNVVSAPVTQVQAPTALPVILPRPTTLWVISALILSLFQPVLGLGLGFLYAPQEDRAARNFGRWCLVAATVGWLLALMTGAVKTAMSGGGEWFIQPY